MVLVFKTSQWDTVDALNGLNEEVMIVAIYFVSMNVQVMENVRMENAFVKAHILVKIAALRS